MANLLSDFQDILLAERVAAAARKRAPKKAPAKIPSKPVILDVVKREKTALQYLRDTIFSVTVSLRNEKEYIEEVVKTLEKERAGDKAEAEVKGMKLLVSDTDFEKELEQKKSVSMSVVYDIYNSLHKSLDYLADTLDINEQVTRETELTKAVKDFAKLFDSEKSPKDDPEAISEALGLFHRVESDLPDSLTSPSKLGKFRDCCKLMADAINVLSKNNLKAPKIPKALEEENPLQLGFGFTARHYVQLAIAKEAAGYDYLVKDREYLPRPLTAKYIKLLKTRIGRGTQVKIIKSDTIMPRGWDYGNYTVLEITPPGTTESVKAALTLNIASNETSGIATLDAPYGTIPVPRSNYSEQVVNWLTSEIGNLLKPEKTARHYVRLAMLKSSTINDAETLEGLLEMELENIESDRSSATLNSEIKSAARAYDDAVERVLKDWAKGNLSKLDLEKGPLKGCTDADDVVGVLSELRGGAGYLYFMEAEGAGVGTWDGDWDPCFKDEKTLNELSKIVKSKTRAAHQKLKSALEDRAQELAEKE